MTLPLPVLTEFSEYSTRYQKSIKPVPAEPAKSGLFVLKDAGYNDKLGNRMQKSRWKGFPLFALTLVERATCWSGCQNLSRCFGDNMPFAHRYEPGAALERAVATDVATLAARRATERGFLVRLHVLGDFYSVAYVEHWESLIRDFTPLHLYGYTHWRHHSPIGRAVSELVQRHPDRASFLRSDADELDDPLPKAMTIARGEAAVPGTVLCPEQAGTASSCATCGLCMGGRVSVSFIDHSRRRPQLVSAA